MKHYSFPSIEQFNNVIRNVKKSCDYTGKDENGDPIYNHAKDYPILKFKGTVKLHGTNSAIIFPTNYIKDFYCQSRERIITCQSDNVGFCAFVYSLPIDVLNILFIPQIGIYAEWCGGNIQKNVGLNGLPKMMIIFSEKNINDENSIWNSNCRFTDEELNILNKYNIYHNNQFKTFEIDIDFNHPEMAQNELIKLTEEVEKECPITKYFYDKLKNKNILEKENGDIVVEEDLYFMINKIKLEFKPIFKKLRDNGESGDISIFIN